METQNLLEFQSNMETQNILMAQKDQKIIINKIHDILQILDKLNKLLDLDIKNKEICNVKLKFIDLFAGIGGFHQALTNLGYECVLSSEINEECRNTYNINYKLMPMGDIKSIVIKDIPNFDILCAGFPCQPFSKAGTQKGFNDCRGNLFFNICNIAKHHKPKYMILENVKNLASHDKGNTWNQIKKNIKELGYYTYDIPLVLNTLYFNIPQSRDRVVILCKRMDLGKLNDLQICPKNTKNTNLRSIMEINTNPKYKISDKLKQTETVWNNFIKISHDNNILIPKFPIWTDWWDSDGNNTTVTKKDNKKTDTDNITDIIKKQKDFYIKYKDWIDKNRNFYNTNYKLLNPWLINSRNNYNLWKGAVRKLEWQAGDKKINMNEVLWSPRGSGVRVKNLDYAPTLVAMASMIPVYGPESRHLTPRECARLQSFPENFIINTDDNESYKQFGNAVNVKMIQKCANFLINDAPLF